MYTATKQVGKKAESDYCPMWSTAIIGRVCTESASTTSPYNNLNFMREVFSAESRCFESTLRKSVSGFNDAADSVYANGKVSCYQVACATDGASYTVKVATEGTDGSATAGTTTDLGTCSTAGATLTSSGYVGTITCADPAEICQIKPNKHTLGSWITTTSTTTTSTSTTSTSTTTTSTTTTTTTTTIAMLSGSLSLSVALPDGGTGASFVADAQVKAGFEKGISTELQIPASWVTVLLSLVSNGSNGRRLSTVQVSVGYTILVHGDTDSTNSFTSLYNAIGSVTGNEAKKTAWSNTLAAAVSSETSATYTVTLEVAEAPTTTTRTTITTTARPTTGTTGSTGSTGTTGTTATTGGTSVTTGEREAASLARSIGPDSFLVFTLATILCSISSGALWG